MSAAAVAPNNATAYSSTHEYFMLEVRLDTTININCARLEKLFYAEIHSAEQDGGSGGGEGEVVYDAASF